jgi:hypothetical protein
MIFLKFWTDFSQKCTLMIKVFFIHYINMHPSSLFVSLILSEIGQVYHGESGQHLWEWGLVVMDK